MPQVQLGKYLAYGNPNSLEQQHVVTKRHVIYICGVYEFLLLGDPVIIIIIFFFWAHNIYTIFLSLHYLLKTLRLRKTQRV